MWSSTVIRQSTLAACVLWLSAVTLAQAVTYRVEPITPAEVGNITYTIYSGNQYLNNRGQVVGESRTHSDDKVYNEGPRVFRWSQGRIQTLGTLGSDALGYGASKPAAINDAGLVAGHSRRFIRAIDRGPHAVVWREGHLLYPRETGAFVASEPVAMNARGEVVGAGRRFEQGQDRGTRALLWTAEGLRDLGTLGTNPGNPAWSWSVATAINSKRHVVGSSNIFNSEGFMVATHAFLWNNGTMHDLGFLGVDPGFSYSSATAINTNRQIVGSSDIYDSAGNWLGSHAFLWNNGTMHDLGVLGVDLGFSASSAIAINANNQVLGSSDVYDSAGNRLGQHAFLWSGGTMQDLGALGVNEFGESLSIPNALNDAGHVVGWSTHAENGVASGNRAFLYQNGAMVDLNTLLPADSGLLLTDALAVNNRGQITAFGTRTTAADTYQVYVLLTPVRR